MNKRIRSVAGLSLASLLMIVACCRSGVCSEQASPPAESAGGDAKSVPGKFSLQEFNERVIKAHGDRMKWILFRNSHNTPCFRLTGLLSASGDRDRVGLVVPIYEMDGVGVGRGPGERIEKAVNPATFIFADSVCRLTITISKLALLNGVESLLPPLEQPPDVGALIEKAKLLSGSANTGSDPLKSGGGAVEVHGNRLEINPKASDPNKVGTFGIGTAFGSSQLRLTFSGIIWFSSYNFSLYLANAPADMTIESGKNDAAKAYEIDVSMPDARMRLSVRKDILQDGSWIPDFDD